jgi:hypothetical protein
MTEHHLPDDVARWPVDPYALLGIDANVDERGLKRAYAKLIRKFKPEHHPQEFTRIRAAFEHVQSRLSWLSLRHNFQAEEELDQDRDLEETRIEIPVFDLDADSPQDQPATAEPKNSDTNSADRPPEPNQPKRTANSKSDAQQAAESAWLLATHGDPATGYQQLRMLAERTPTPTETCLKLYWLLRLFPEVDPAGNPSHWLVVALRQSHLNGPAWELYGIELERQPQLVAVQEHLSLLDCATSAERLFDLLECRWRVASRHGGWNLIESDLRKVRPDVQTDATEMWAQMLFRALDLAAWSSNSSAKNIVQFCRYEIEKLSELHFRLSHQFDRSDLLGEMLSQTPLDFIHHTTDELTDLIRDHWNEPYLDRTQKLRSLLAGWAANPRQALIMLTAVRKDANIAFHQIYNLVRELNFDESAHQFPNRAKLILETCQRFVMQRRRLPYYILRVEILEFCLENGIELTELLNVSKQVIEMDMIRGTKEAMENDLELQILVRGIIAFWAAPE